MSIKNVRKEVMLTLQKNIDVFFEKFLIVPEKFGSLLIFFPILNQILL